LRDVTDLGQHSFLPAEGAVSSSATGGIFFRF
jgi:hypothetical protein